MTVLEGRRLVICAGPGGAGKSITAAAVALGMAAAGARAALVAIDPVTPLGNAQGVGEQHNDRVRISPHNLTTDGRAVKGELWTVTVDAKRTFDDFVEQRAPDPTRAAAIKANRVYRELSTPTPSSQEFAAVSQLVDLDRSGRFERLVLDTPPAPDPLDFLQAARRLRAFLDSRVVRSASPLMSVMGRLSGGGLLADASAFFRLLGPMTDDFNERAAQIETMLRAPTTGFLLVTTPEPPAVDETIRLGRKLLDGGYPLTGVVVNRVHRRLGPKSSQADINTILGNRFSVDLAERVAASVEAYESRARRDRSSIAKLRRDLPGRPIVTVPHLPRDVDDMAALRDVHRHLAARRAGTRATTAVHR